MLMLVNGFQYKGTPIAVSVALCVGTRMNLIAPHNHMIPYGQKDFPHQARPRPIRMISIKELTAMKIHLHAPPTQQKYTAS